MPGPGPSGSPNVAWRFQAGGGFTTSPVVEAGVAYAVSGDGVVHALALATGIERWQVKLNAKVDASPILVDGDVIVADDVGVVHTLAEADGTAQWTFVAGGSVSGSPAADDDRIVVATQKGSVYELVVATGRVLWRASMGGPVVRSVAIADGTAYLGVGRAVAAIAVENGAPRWRTDVATDGAVGTPSVSGGLVFAAVAPLAVSTAHREDNSISCAGRNARAVANQS